MHSPKDSCGLRKSTAVSLILAAAASPLALAASPQDGAGAWKLDSTAPLDFPPEKPEDITNAAYADGAGDIQVVLRRHGVDIEVVSGSWLVKLGAAVDPISDPNSSTESSGSGVSSMHHAEVEWGFRDKDHFRGRAQATPFTSLSEAYTFNQNLHSIQGDDAPALFDGYQYSGDKVVSGDSLLPDSRQVSTPEATSMISGYWVNLSAEERPTALVFAHAEVEFDPTKLDVAGTDEYTVGLAGSVMIDIDILGPLALSRSISVETHDEAGEIAEQFVMDVIDKPTKEGAAEAALEAAVALLDPSPEYPVPSYKKDGIKRVDQDVQQDWFGSFSTLTTASVNAYYTYGWIGTWEGVILHAFLDGRVRGRVRLYASADDMPPPPTTGGGDTTPPTTGGGGGSQEPPVTGGSGSEEDEDEDDGRPRGPVTPRPDGPHRESEEEESDSGTPS